MTQQKIRPPNREPAERSHGTSSAALRDEGEGDLPDMARAPDPGPAIEGAISANASDSAAHVGHTAIELTQAELAAFSPAEAARLRADHQLPNATYGKPYRPNQAEQLLAEYMEAESEMKRIYAGTRSLAGEKRFLIAKEAMIKAGLMKGDV